MSRPLRLSDVVRSSLNPAWGALAKSVTKRWNAATSPIAAPARKAGTAQSMSTDDDDDSLKLLKSSYVEAARNTSPPIQESIPRSRASVDAPKGPCSP